MRSIELFSGCGGLALGLSRAGFRHDRMIEWNSDAVATIKHNAALSVEHVEHWPIEQMDARLFDAGSYFKQVDLIAGGPPCQPFSIGGKHKGPNDDRDMWPVAVRSVRQSGPRGFLFENVKGLTRSAFSEYVEWIIHSFERPSVSQKKGEGMESHLHRLRSSRKHSEYDVVLEKVNAADFGAPQKRHRVIIAGVRRDLGVRMTPLKPTHSRERLLYEQWVTGEYWARHGLPVPSDERIERGDRSLVANLRASLLVPETKPWVTVRDALIGLGEPDGKNNHVFQGGARSYVGHTGSILDMPAKALKAGDHGVPGGENMMVKDDGTVRYFTTREAARLQGLPDEYQFPGSWTESMRQLGNAVPTQLAEVAGKWISAIINHTAGEIRSRH